MLSIRLTSSQCGVPGSQGEGNTVLLPLHSTHLVQPLDKALALKVARNEVCKTYRTKNPRILFIGFQLSELFGIA